MRQYWKAIPLAVGVMFHGWLAASEADLGYPPFPHGTIEESTAVEGDDSRVFLGAVNEVNNELRANREVRKSWHGLRRMIGIGRNYSVNEVADYYRAQIREKEATVVFECDGRSCGNSNVWANRVFGESKLYGRDDTQLYLVTAWPDTRNRVQFNTLYLIQRGNREVYAYEQAFRLPEGERVPGFELKDRRIFGPVVLRWSNPDSPSMDASAEQYREIIDLAEEHEDGRLYLLGFSPLEEGSLDTVMEQTGEAIEVLRDILTDRGLDGSRIESRVIGPLVKTAEAGRAGRRIEVMLVREKDND